MAFEDEGIARSLAKILQDVAPPNSVAPTGGFGLTLDENGRIPDATVLAPFTGAAGTLTVSSTGAVSWGSAVGRGTSLPASPTDGQEYILVDSTTAPTYQWRFRYSSTNAGSYKWEFCGGSPAIASVATDENTNSTSYVALATAGPTITLPAAGDYIVELGCAVHANAGAVCFASMSYDIGGTGAVDGDRVVATTNVSSSTGADNIARAVKKSGLTAVALTAKYKVSGNSAGFINRWLKVTPVAVG